MPQPNNMALATKPLFSVPQPKASAGYAGCSVLPDFLRPIPKPRETSPLAAMPAPQPVEPPADYYQDPALHPNMLARRVGNNDAIEDPVERVANDILALIDELSNVKFHFVRRRLQYKQHEFNQIAEHMVDGKSLDWQRALRVFAETPKQLMPFMRRQRVRMGRGATGEAIDQRTTMGYMLGLDLWTRALLRQCDKSATHARSRQNALNLLNVTSEALDQAVNKTLGEIDGGKRKTLRAHKVAVEAKRAGLQSDPAPTPPAPAPQAKRTLLVRLFGGRSNKVVPAKKPASKKKPQPPEALPSPPAFVPAPQISVSNSLVQPIKITRT